MILRNSACLTAACLFAFVQNPATAQRRPMLFVYGGGCVSNHVSRFESLMGRPVDGVLAGMGMSNWVDLQNSLLAAQKCWATRPARQAIFVPMLVRGATLQEGLTGAYDDQFRRVAATLMRFHRGDAYLRIGWEFNGGWYPWRASANPHAWVNYFRRISMIFKNTPGAHFQIVWNPALNKEQIAPDQVYPGDDVVDVIAGDIYNIRRTPDQDDPEVRWQSYLQRPYGLEWLARFGKSHHKPIAIPEWGTGENKEHNAPGDDPVFVQRMAAWMKANGVLFHGYWDFNAGDYNSRVSNGRFPKTADALRKAFGRP